MERLTFDGNFCDIAKCGEINGGSSCKDGYCSQRKVWERLKQYENAEETINSLIDKICHSPLIDALNRLAEYEDAEAEGRLVMLPCKIGDTVWVIRNYRGVNHPQLGEVSEMFFDVDMALQIVVKHVGRGKFGEKVFRTLEEAEQALKGDSE